MKPGFGNENTLARDRTSTSNAIWDLKARSRRSRSHPAWRHVLDYMLGRFDAELSSARNILEVGCGTGNVALELQEHTQAEVIAVDLSEPMVRACTEAGGRGIVADISALPFADSQFDVVIAAGVLHHIDDVETAVAEMGRVSRSHVLACEPNLFSPLMMLSALRPHEWTAWRCPPARIVRAFSGEVGPVRAEFGGFVAENLTPRRLLPMLAALEPIIDRLAARWLGLGLYISARKESASATQSD